MLGKRKGGCVRPPQCPGTSVPVNVRVAAEVCLRRLSPKPRARRLIMNSVKAVSEHHVLPRLVERLPDYAHAKARQTLAERLVEAFGLSQVAAAGIANAV